MTVQVRGLSGRSDATGHFVLRGNAPAGELTLSIDAAGHLPAKTPFLLGAENLRVQLASAASLAGSVRLDDVVTASDVIVELISGKDSEQERVTVRGQLGEFTFASLPPGNATAKVHVLGETDSGLVVADLPLRAGEVTRDPRLQNVDLSAGRRAVHFTVVDQAGRPVPEARVAVLTGPGQNTFEGYMLTAGQGRIVTRVASLAVLVFAAGYRSVAVTDLADGAAITLPPPLAVRLQLPAESPLPPPPFALTARFTRDDSGWPSQTNFRFYSGLNNSYSGDGSPPWVQPVTAVCGADGSALVQVTEPGTYGLNWRLSRHSPGDRTDRWLANDPPTIRVQDVAGEQSVRAGPTAEQLAAARARLGDAR
jgi:hypothetical protein